MPTLKAAAHAYTFAIPGTQMFYTVLVAEGTMFSGMAAACHLACWTLAQKAG